MARRQLTPEEMAAKVAKAKATREANKQKALEQAGIKARPKVKVRKARKPMTKEQKAAAVERLAKARAARAMKDSDGPKYTQYAPEIVALPDEHPLSLKNTKAYLKAAQQVVDSIKSMKDSSSAADRLEYLDAKTYVENLKAYMRSGTYTDFRVGGQREQRLRMHSVKMAYHADGTPKRTVGVWYPDLGTEWTREMEQNGNGSQVPDKKPVRRAG